MYSFHVGYNKGRPLVFNDIFIFFECSEYFFSRECVLKLNWCTVHLSQTYQSVPQPLYLHCYGKYINIL